MALKSSKITWKRRKCLKGDTIADLDEYLRGLMGPPEPDHRFVHPVCKQCGGDVFSLIGDGDGMSRVCVACVAGDDEVKAENATHYIADSGDYWDEDEEDEYGCPCGKSEDFRLSVAFRHVDVVDAAGKPAGRFVKWVYVGGMCVLCGVVGLYADWKVSYSPTDHLYDLA